MVHIYHGDGKGKSTASFGLAVRALGQDYHVILAQFLKSRDVGEIRMLNSLENILVLRPKIDNVFSFQMTDAQKENTLLEHNILFKNAINAIDCTQKTLIIFDEIIGATTENLIDRVIVIKFLEDNKENENLEIVLTGRNPIDEYIKNADYITKMEKERHPYDKGVMMRKGVEY